MHGEITVAAFEGVDTAPASMQVALGSSPVLDVLALGGLIIALVAAVLLLFLNREERPHTV